MKILKYILIVIVGLVLGFLLVGLLNPSVDYGHEITVTKSAKDAWGVTQDDSKYSQWLEGFQSMELISGEKGAVGCKHKVIVNPGEGQEDFELIETVIAVEEFEYIEMNFTSETMDFEQIISFSEADGKTTVKTETKVFGKGMMMRSMFAMMESLSGSFQAQEVKNIEALKTLIEENTTDYYPAPVIVEEVDSIPEMEME